MGRSKKLQEFYKGKLKDEKIGGSEMIEITMICDDCGCEMEHVLTDYGDIVPRYGYEVEGGHYCEDCFFETYQYCENCGEIFEHEQMIWHEGRNVYYCIQCYPEYNYRELHDYHDSPELTPLGGTWGDRLYGLELEMELIGSGSRISCIRDINDNVGDIVFFQRDGSLDYGMELITLPATLAYHTNNINWHTMCNIAKKHGFKSHDTDTCGLHIHVSKDALGDSYSERDLVIAKLMIIIDKYWDKVVQFSRRDIVQLNEWAKKPSDVIIGGGLDTFNVNDSIDTIIHKSKETRFDRYSAINIRNDNTIEFRFFRGTLKYTTILASIQFVDTLIDYVQKHTLEELFQANFNDIVTSDFVELNSYLKERGL